MITLPKLTKPRQKINLLIAALFVAVQLPFILFINNTNAVTNPFYSNTESKVEICHATSSTTNPYSVSTPPKRQDVSKNALNGHDGHVGPVFPDTDAEGNWGDIIPPFEAKSGSGGSGWEAFEGLNWNSEGQAIWANNCGVPSPVGSITIIKDVKDGTDVQDFDFTATGTGVTGFTLDDDGETANLSNQEVFNTGLSAGQYSFTEAAIAGWNVSVSCTGATGVSSNGGRTVTFTLGTANVVCTFVNEKQVAQLGSITIVKDADSSDLQEFIFSATGLTGVTTFALIDKVGVATTEQNTKTYPNLTAKEYTFTEQAKAGWELVSITCVDDETKAAYSGATTSIALRKATINLGEGDKVTCTFDNNETAVLGEGDEDDRGVVLSATTGGQGGEVLGASAEAAVGGVSAGYGAAAGASLSSLAGLGASLSALGFGVTSLRKRQ